MFTIYRMLLRQYGDTALIVAASWGYAAVCSALIEKGASVDITNKVFESVVGCGCVLL